MRGEKETESDHDSRRTRRLVGGIASAVGARGLAAVAPLLLVPITFRYLGAEVYGLWAAIVSLTSMAVWADLGLGNGLLTRLTPALARRDFPTGRRLIATAYTILGCVAVLALVGLGVIGRFVPWSSVLNIDDTRALELAPVVAAITVGAFIVNIPLSLVQRLQYANQEVAVSNAWLAVGSVTSVALAWLAVLGESGVPTVILAVAIGPVASNVVNTVWFFHRHRALLPRMRDVGGEASRGLIGLGGRFLAVTLLSAVAMNVDTIIVTHIAGLGEAATFSVAFRLMTALGLLVTLINTPLWPANAEALARGDLRWVRRITRRMSAFSAAAVLLPGLSLVAVEPWVFRLWLGDDAALPGRGLVFAFALWWSVLAATSSLFMVQNAAGVIAPQLAGWSAYLVVSVPFKVVVGQHLGAVGVVAVAVAAYATLVVPFAIMGYRRALDRAPAGPGVVLTSGATT